MSKSGPYHTQSFRSKPVPNTGGVFFDVTVERVAGSEDELFLYVERHVLGEDAWAPRDSIALFLSNKDADALATTIMYVAKMLRET